MIIRILQILLLLFLLEQTAYASWIVYDDGRYTISSEQVIEHIENVYLNEDQQFRLFNEAGRNYSNYLSLKTTWINSRFPTAAKELSFYKLVEKIAYLESERLGYYVAFRNADELQLKNLRYELYQNLEASIQKNVYKGQRRISVSERVEFQKQYGKSLIQKGYPKRSEQDAIEVYQEWYQDQINKIEKQAILQLTAEGIQEFEGFIQAQGYEFRFASPIEISHAYSKAEALLLKWQEEGRTHTDTFKFLQANPDVKALVKDFYPESPRFLALEKIMEKYPNRINEIKSIVRDNASEVTDQELIQETIAIKDMAMEMLTDGLSNAELEEGKESMMQEYQSTGEYHYLYTARAFDLAITLRDLDIETIEKSIHEVVTPSLDNILKNISVAITNETFFSESYQSYSLSEAARKFATGFISSSNLTETESKLLASGIWFIKLKFENLFKDFKNDVIFERNERHHAMAKIDQVLREQRRNSVRREAIENYTLNLFITIQPEENGSLITGAELFEYLFTE